MPAITSLKQIELPLLKAKCSLMLARAFLKANEDRRDCARFVRRAVGAEALTKFRY